MFRTKTRLFALSLFGALTGAALFFSAAPRVRAEAQTLYIGTYTRDANGGICAADFDSQSGQLSRARVVAVTPNPSWIALAPDGKTLYAANESGAVAGENSGGVSAFAVENGGALKPLNARAVPNGLAHLSVDATGCWLAGASYGGGNVSLWPLEKDGALGERAALIQHSGHGPNANRQEAPHAHQVVFSPDNSKIWVADLGLDQVLIYLFNAKNGAVQTENPLVAPLAPGSGPRHLTFGDAGQRAYVISELTNTITLFDATIKAPIARQIISTLPADATGADYAAEVQIARDGRFLYASNRGDVNGISVFSIGPNGLLKAQSFAATGRSPRHFTLDPSGRWLLAANQQDRSISVFAVNAESGALTFSSRLEEVPGEPTCVVF